MDRLITIEELVEKLSVSKATIYAWTSRGRIPHVKVGSRLIRFRESEIIAWLDSQESKKTSAPFHFIKKQRPAREKINFADEYVNRVVESAKRKVLT